MRKWELLAIVVALAAVVGTPLAAFGYQAYRESQSGSEGAPVRAASILPPPGNAVAGRQVFLDNCAVCHGQDARGVVGPDLHGVTTSGATFLYAFVANPETVNNRATMPRVPLSRQEIADAVAYLMTLPTGPEVAQVEAPAAGVEGPAQREIGPDENQADAPGAEEGKSLYQSKGCVACHGPEAQGTPNLAPSLVGKTAEAIRTQVRTPKEKMPPFGPAQLSDVELEAIIRYIESLSP